MRLDQTWLKGEIRKYSRSRTSQCAPNFGKVMAFYMYNLGGIRGVIINTRRLLFLSDCKNTLCIILKYLCICPTCSVRGTIYHWNLGVDNTKTNSSNKYLCTYVVRYWLSSCVFCSAVVNWCPYCYSVCWLMLDTAFTWIVDNENLMLIIGCILTYLKPLITQSCFMTRPTS